MEWVPARDGNTLIEDDPAIGRRLSISLYYSQIIIIIIIAALFRHVSIFLMGLISKTFIYVVSYFVLVCLRRCVYMCSYVSVKVAPQSGKHKLQDVVDISFW